jgi:hypothetical protein
MYNLEDGDHPWFAIAYCIFVVIIGNFFLMNLILAVIADTYMNINEAEQEEDAALYLQQSADERD